MFKNFERPTVVQGRLYYMNKDLESFNRILCIDKNLTFGFGSSMATVSWWVKKAHPLELPGIITSAYFHGYVVIYNGNRQTIQLHENEWA